MIRWLEPRWVRHCAITNAALRAASALSAIVFGVGQALAGEFSARDIAQFEAAVKTARAGDAIVLESGEWSDVDLRFKAYGTESKPITLKARSPGAVIFTGASRLRLGGDHLIVDGLWFRDPHPTDSEVIEFRIDSKLHASHCRLTNCAITSTHPADKGSRSARWVSLYGAHNRVDHCRFAGKLDEGTTLVVWLGYEAEGHHRIDHNHFDHRPPLGKNGGETIRIGDSASSLRDAHCIVERNLFERCNGEGEIISNKSCANTYRQNAFLECEGALTLRHGHRCLVEGNWFFGNHQRMTGGVRIVGDDHRVLNNYFENLEGDEYRCALTLMNGIPDTPFNGYSQVKRALVAFNTLVDCKRSILIGMSHDKKCTLPPADTWIANNIVLSEKRPLIEAAADISGIRWTGNITWGKALGIPPQDGIHWQNPKLEKHAAALWRPSNDSPVIDAAAAIKQPPKQDIDGQLRSDRFDVGCDEHSDAPKTIRPPSRNEVGPSWQ